MKKLLVSLIFILCISCFATPPSFTNVTATLTDGNGQIWTNGTWTVELVPAFGNPNTPLNNGNPITDSPQSGVMDGSGTFTVTLDDNTKIFPSGSTWKFTLCPNASVTNCSQSIQVVNGASQNLSGSISADLKPISTFALPVLNRAYSDTQVSASTGALYWRVTDNVIRGKATNGTWNTIGFLADIFNQANVWNGTQIYNNNITAKGISSFINLNGTQYADQFSGSDWCAKVIAAIAALPSAGGTVNARGFIGNQTCSANPFASVTKPVYLLWGNYTVTTTVKWTIARSNIVIEGMHGQPGETSSTTSFLQADVGFPINTPVIEMGDNLGLYFGMRVEWLRIHCGGTTGSTGILIRGLNENSGLDHVSISECVSNAVKIDGSSQITANFAINDLNINYSGGAGTAGDAVVIGGTNTLSITIQRVSIVSTNLQTSSAIHLLSTLSTPSGIFIRDVHDEAYTDGVKQEGGNLILAGFGAYTNTINALHITNANAITTSATEIGNNAVANVVILNDVTGTNVASTNPPVAGGTVPFYTWSRTANNEVYLDNTGFHISGLSILKGSIDPSIAGVSAPQGSLYLRTNGTTFASLYTKTGSLDINWTSSSNTNIGHYTALSLTGLSIPVANIVTGVGIPAGYEIKYYLTQTGVCTTGSTSVTVTLTWNDGSSRSFTTSPLTLGATNPTSAFLTGTIPAFVNSGNITEQADVTGTCTTGGPATYKLFGWVDYNTTF